MLRGKVRSEPRFTLRACPAKPLVLQTKYCHKQKRISCSSASNKIDNQSDLSFNMRITLTGSYFSIRVLRLV